MKKKLKALWIKTWSGLKPYMTPRMIPILFLVWMMTNGIWYFLAFANLGVPLISRLAKGYLVFLYMPGTPEKILIIFISLKIYQMIYKEKFTKIKC